MFIDYMDLVVRKSSKLSDKMCNKYVADLINLCKLRNAKEERKTPIPDNNSMTFICLKARKN